MGQMQVREAEGKRQQAEGSSNNHHDLKDRVGAKFQKAQAVNDASGTGSKGNPGKSV